MYSGICSWQNVLKLWSKMFSMFYCMCSLAGSDVRFRSTSIWNNCFTTFYFGFSISSCFFFLSRSWVHMVNTIMFGILGSCITTIGSVHLLMHCNSPWIAHLSTILYGIRMTYPRCFKKNCKTLFKMKNGLNDNTSQLKKRYKSMYFPYIWNCIYC